MLKKIEKVKDFSFIRKGPYYRDIFNQIQGHPPPPRCPTKNLGPIGSAVLTFIGLLDTNKQTDKQTNKQTDKPNLYIDM